MLESYSRRGARRAARRAQLRRPAAVAAGILVTAAVVAVISLSSSSRSSSTSALHAGAGNVGQHPASGPGSAALSTSGMVGIRTIKRLAQLGRPIYCAGSRGNAVAFTFDDGPGPYTNLALNKLREAKERATFFVVGRSIDHFPGYLRRELQLAAIGDHSYTHPLLSALPSAEVTSQLARSRARIEHDSGQPVTLFRPPYGGRSAAVDEVAKRLGLLDVIWTADSGDALGANYTGIIRNVEAGLRPGAIILMHENRGQTIRALTTLLPELHRRHLRSVSLPELFASDPPSVAQVMRGRAGCGIKGRVPNGGS